MPGENASGHWLYAFLRSDLTSGNAYLCVINLHPDSSLTNVRVRFPDSALWLLPGNGDYPASLIERVSTSGSVRIDDVNLPQGVFIPEIAPLTPYFFELQFSAD
jgi:hypothetical protein